MLIYDIPERRYAIFSDVVHGNQFVVIYGADMKMAPSWGGFVRWFGGVKERRKVYSKHRVTP